MLYDVHERVAMLEEAMAGCRVDSASSSAVVRNRIYNTLDLIGSHHSSSTFTENQNAGISRGTVYRYDVPRLSFVYRMLLAPTSGRRALVSSPHFLKKRYYQPSVRSGNKEKILRSLNLLESTVVTQSRSSVSLITLDQQDGLFGHTLDALALDVLLADIFVYDDVPSILYSFHCPSSSNGFRIGVFDLHSRREKARSPVFH
eukprot:Protomagalhaensia_sp_Gyna_25__4443@NODE_406_length_3550_cov_9_261464_g312_i0_p2_GENE_NODE_406_length_3550_cov_9_261464_g312_i0NODE_406_length_3550_cov_9_261464_g312_i0_p2_ORF_typecomplete_len202_score31_03TetR_N/PF00440_23/0_42HTH_7/PF02796_15/0_4_NODE_406_length_3550_cov_9_261464_g312_i07511356